MNNYEFSISFEATINALPQLISYVDKNLIYRYVNKNYEIFFNKSKDEIIGKPLKEVIGEKVFNQDSSYIKRIVQGETIQYQEHFHYQHGKILYVDGNLIPDYDDNQEIRGYYGIITDITPHKTVLRELQENEARFRAIFTQGTLPKLLIDPGDGRIIDANPAAEFFYGFTREQLLQKNIADINMLHPDEIRQAMEMAKTLKKSSFNFKHQCQNGEIRDVEIYSTPLEFLGKHYLYSIIIDVTARKRTEQKLVDSEKKLNDYFINSTDAISLTDEEGNVIEWNPMSEEITGISRNDVLEKPIWDVQYQLFNRNEKTRENHRALQKQIKSFFRTGKADWLNKIYEREICDASGDFKIVQAVTFPIKTSKGFMIGSSMRDVTEIRHLEQARNELQMKNRELATISLYLNEKNELLREIQNVLSLSKEVSIQQTLDNLNKLAALITSNLNYDKDWILFKKHFEQVHVEFFRNLKKTHPDLTQHELRHCACIKMNFSTKEIARLFNVKSTSIQTARVRLKKKMLLSKETDLISYIQGF